jgi:general secretion pathway protein G
VVGHCLAGQGTGLEEFKTDNGRYPGALNELLDGEKEYVIGSRISQDPWGKAYVYKCPGEQDPGGYDLLSCGPDGLASTEDDITRWDTDNR